MLGKSQRSRRMSTGRSFSLSSAQVIGIGRHGRALLVSTIARDQPRARTHCVVWVHMLQPTPAGNEQEVWPRWRCLEDTLLIHGSRDSLPWNSAVVLQRSHVPFLMSHEAFHQENRSG
jgi:hypothetical protein